MGSNQQETIPALRLPPGLVNLEEAICETLRRREAGMNNPMSREADPSQVEWGLSDLGHALGYRYAGVTFSTYKIYDARQVPVVERLMEFAKDIRARISNGSGLILSGPVGTGKDHLLAALLKVAIARHRFTASWFDCQRLFEEARAAIQKGAEHEFRIKLTDPQILALSDPQPPKGELSEYQCGIIRDVIDRRYRRGLSTWITTNLGSRETAEGVLTAPVMDRLREGAMQELCEWPSYRSK